MNNKIIEQLHNTSDNIFGKSDKFRYFFSPGRVNLIGEHLDYNGGYVLPCAIDIGTYAVTSVRNDKIFSVYSANFPETGIIEFNPNQLINEKSHYWANYTKGVIKEILRNQPDFPHGLNICYYGNLPNGAGLSSSASIEVLTANILKSYFNLAIDDIQIIKACQKAENEFIGVGCGIMDQFICTLGQKEQAILLNCDTLNFRYTPLHLGEYQLIIGNTNKKRTLSDSKYKERLDECKTALRYLQKNLNLHNLCDLDLKTFNEQSHLIDNKLIYRRALHVISENIRTRQAVVALKSNDMAEFGNLLKQSHLSLRDDYEVTGFELDAMVDAAWSFSGCLGGRMTGAGFGGCTVNLVRKNKIDDFIKFVGDEYTKQTKIIPSFYVVRPSDGCHELFI